VNWASTRVDRVMTVVRSTVQPSELLAREVIHYSIPALEASGRPALEDVADIGSSKQLLHGGELLVSKLNPRKSRIVIATTHDVPAVCSGEFVVLRPHNCETRFMRYLFLAESTRQFLSSQTRSATRSQQRVEPSAISKLPFRSPPLPEQRAIADYLDLETARIDAWIDKKERLVQLLEERLAAAITILVVGADIGKRRSTGSKFVPQIPQAWELQPLRRIASRIDVGIAEAATHAYADAGVAILRSTNIRPNEIRTNDLLYIEPWFAERNSTKYLHAADLVTVRTGKAGVTAVVPPELDRTQCFTMLMTTLIPPHNSLFFAYFLNSMPARRYFHATAWGTAQPNISVPILGNAPVPVPPVSVQREIADRITAIVQVADGAADRLREQVGLLHERRQALITAAVTGQFDVSGAA